MQRNSMRALALMSLVAVAFTVPSFGQETLDDGVVMKLVEQALPKWDESMLEVREGKDWTRELGHRNVFAVMEDEAPEVKGLPDDAGRLGDDDHVVSLDRGRGRVRYVSRSRGWSYRTDAKSRAVEPDKALEMIASAVGELGVPSEEFGEPRVDTQMGGGAPSDRKEIQDRFEMYRIVSIPRMMGEYPVYRSRVRGAVSNRGQVQRLMVEWPAFRMPEKLAMRSRERVVREAVKEIMSQDPSGEITVQAVLAYAAAAQDDEESIFLPSVVISVLSEPTPYQLVIPVAGRER